MTRGIHKITLTIYHKGNPSNLNFDLIDASKGIPDTGIWLYQNILGIGYHPNSAIYNSSGGSKSGEEGVNVRILCFNCFLYYTRMTLYIYPILNFLFPFLIVLYQMQF